MQAKISRAKSSRFKKYPDWYPCILIAELRSDAQWYLPWVIAAFSFLLQFYFNHTAPNNGIVWAYPAIVSFLLIDGWGYASAKWNQANMDLLQMCGIRPSGIILARLIHLTVKCTLMVAAYAVAVQLSAPELNKSPDWGHLMVFMFIAIGMAMPLCFFTGVGKALVIFLGLILLLVMSSYHQLGANLWGVWSLDLALSLGFGYLFSHIKLFSLYGSTLD